MWQGGGCGDFCDPSHLRTEAQSRAKIESPRAQGPYTARCELCATTPPRMAAHIQYRRRYRCAFGNCLPPRDPRPYVVDEDPNAIRPHSSLRYRPPATEAIFAPSWPPGSATLRQPTSLAEKHHFDPDRTTYTRSQLAPFGLVREGYTRSELRSRGIRPQKVSSLAVETEREIRKLPFDTPYGVALHTSRATKHGRWTSHG